MNISSPGSDEQRWVERIREGDEEAFEEMFYAYYPRLCGFAERYVDSTDIARGVVQDVFLKIWERRTEWILLGGLKPYLYQAVRNQALNYIERRDRIVEMHDQQSREVRATDSQEELYGKELAGAIWDAIDELPRRRRMAFVLHRQHGLSYEQVGQVMGITAKTVENQIGRALKYLRKAVAPERV
jgi:RNA polymerase sigma-70 factor (ECF subfamily)